MQGIWSCFYPIACSSSLMVFQTWCALNFCTLPWKRLVLINFPVLRMLRSSLIFQNCEARQNKHVLTSLAVRLSTYLDSQWCHLSIGVRLSINFDSQLSPTVTFFWVRLSVESSSHLSHCQLGPNLKLSCTLNWVTLSWVTLSWVTFNGVTIDFALLQSLGSFVQSPLPQFT